MDKTAMRKQTFHLEVTVKSLRLLHDLHGSEKIWLKLFLVNRAGAKEDVILHTVGAVDQEDSKSMLFVNGSGRFEFHETEVSLADYDLVMQLWDRSSKTRAQMMGEWKDPISELRDLIKGRGLQLHFRALMHHGLRNMGEVNMMLDILDSQTTVPHEEPKRSKLPKRRGKTEMERKDKFYLHIGSLGVHASRTRTPYVKVISAEGTVSSTCEYEEVDEVDNATAGFDEVTDALQVKVTAGHAQLRIQLFQDRTESELLGQAIVYEANAEHGPCWRHIYGPRRAGGLSMLGMGVLDSQTEEAEEMARGRLPPSCYHGSLYITCDRFAGRIVGLVSQMTRSLLPSRFRVRLHRGVYLDRYCNQKLLVRVEIPGSAPLLFPGEVNAQGALRFGGDPAEPPGSPPPSALEENNAWVERWSDGFLLEEVSQAFVYIHREYDGLSRPAEVFGTIQLHFAHSPAVPQWSMLQYDRSVLAAQKLPGTAAQGFLLGSATVDMAPAGAAGAVSAATEPPVTTGKAMALLPVYGHVDVLAARNLPASDADGLADPCYEVRFEEMTLKLEEPARRTLNPTFLHRLVLGPLLLPVDEGQGQLMSKDTATLPPMLISVKDKDGVKDQTSFTLLGKAALCNLPSLDYHDEHCEGLDVNRSHQAVWYSLDGDAEVNFEPHLNSSWVLRPRMLIAAGYSTCPDVPKAQAGPVLLEDLEEGQIKRISQIGTEKWMKYNISVDLLGLREVQAPEDVFDQFNHLRDRLLGDLTTPSEKHLEICLTPFWQGAEQSFIPVRLDDGKNCKGQKDPTRSEGFWRSLHPVVSCEKTAPQIPGLPASPSKKSTDWYNLVVLKNPDDRSCGWRLSISNYVAPIVPYLQRPFHKVPVKTLEMPANFKPSKLSSWVLLPDLVFGLRSRNTDLGSVCVTLPMSSHHLPRDLSQQVSKALRTVRVLESERHESHVKHKSWASNIVSIASGKHSESSSHSRQKGKFLPRENEMVEVLKRDATGWTYGRLVEPEPPSATSTTSATPIEGWFPDWWLPPEDADWMQECLDEFQEMDPALQGLPQLPLSEQKEDPYDIYVDVFAEISGKLKWNDNFHVDKQLLTPHLFTIEHEDKQVLHFFNPSDWMAGHLHHAEEAFDHRTVPQFFAEPASTTSGRHEVPYGPAHLWRRVLWGRAGPLRHQRTAELKALAKKKGYRLVSHQHRPEAPGGGHLSENLHTFVRALGHKIQPEQDRDSKLLARLRVCPGTMSYKRKGPIHLYDKSRARWTFIMEPTNLLSALQNGKFVLMVRPGTVEVHPLPDQAIRIHVGPDITVEVPSEELVEQLIEILKQGEAQEHQACSILVVRFHLAGEVVWAPPNQLLTWNEPGQVLFVVKLAETDELVTIPVPSFDLRYPLETIWYPSKTLAGGRDFRPASAAETLLPVDGAAVAPKHKHRVKHVPEDGYSHGIRVSKHAFCCRIMKQGHTRNFDRVRTNNWFRAVLSEVSPDVAALPILEHQDTDFVKEVVLSKLVNVRRRLMAPDDKEVGTLKAHVHLEAVEETDGTPAQIEVVQNVLPVERLWLHDSFALNVYLLTVRGIESPDFRAPYIRAFIMGSEEEPQQYSARLTHDDGSGCDFYHRMTFDLMLPGDGVLVLQLWAKPLLQFTDELLGEAHVDLEDRQMALMYKRLRSASSSPWIQTRLSPSEALEVTTEVNHQHHWGRTTWCDPTKVHQKRLEPGGSRAATLFHPHSRKAPTAYRPHLAPPSPAPIEALALYRDGKQRGKAGTLRTWMDLFTFQERVPEVDFSSLKEIPMPLQVQIKIFQVDGISVFKDFGERNDVYVRGILTCQPVGKQASVALLRTDVHKYAHKMASFNYSWTFDIEAPVRECHMTLELLDQDTVTGADQIYAPKVLSLEPLVAASYFARTWKKAEPSEVHHQVVFDCFPPDHPLRARRWCFCCCKRRGKRPHVHPEPATLSMAIEVTYRESMALPPRIESFAEPKDRVDVRELMLRPQKAFRIILGPKNLRLVKHTCCWCAFLMVVLITLAVAWLFIHVFVVPLK